MGWRGGGWKPDGFLPPGPFSSLVEKYLNVYCVPGTKGRFWILGSWGCIPGDGVSTILEMGKIEALGTSLLPGIIHPVSGQDLSLSDP